MIDKSLSRGLADRTLDEIQRLGRQYPAGCKIAFRAVPERRQAVKLAADQVRRSGEGACLVQVIAAHPKWRWASTCAFVPEMTAGTQGEGRSLAFRTVRTYFHVGRLSLADCEARRLMVVRHHAIERLFQRLNVLSVDAVRAEMHDAMLLAVPLINASVALGHRQMVLPTRSGAFLCDLHDTDGTLVAKTWITRGEQCRHSAPVRIAEEYLLRTGGERGLAAEIGSLPITVPLAQLPVCDRLLRELGQVSWLKDPYSPRADPVGDIWAKAREQQEAA